MRSRMLISVSLLVITALAGPSCDVFLGDDWGWPGYPCDMDRHCRSGSVCYWGVENNGCIKTRMLDELNCSTDDECHTKLDDRFNCDGGYCVAGIGTWVTWCFNYNDDPDDSLCDQASEFPKCKFGICSKSDPPKVFGLDCAENPSACGGSVLECFHFERPGAAPTDRCSEECGNNTFCDENHPGTVCTWTDDGMACANPDWTDGYLAECTDQNDCGVPHDLCPELTNNDAALCTRECNVGDCDEGQSCCSGIIGQPMYCLPDVLCAT